MEWEFSEDTQKTDAKDLLDLWEPEGSKKQANGSKSPIGGRSPYRYDRDTEFARDYNLRQRKTDPSKEDNNYSDHRSINPDKAVQSTIYKYLNPGYSKDDTIDIDFEESLRYFEYSLDKVRAYWTVPLKRLLEINGAVRLESFFFPIGWKKRWKFVADFDKNDSGLTRCYIGIEAILDESETSNPDWERDVNLTMRITLKLGDLDTEKPFNRVFNCRLTDFGIQIPEKMLPEINLLRSDCLIIECTIKENRKLKNSSSERLGLINSGNLCYMNSFLQTLYNLSAFQKLIFKVPFVPDKSESSASLLTALQKLFYNLKYSRRPVSTADLIKSFGWDRRQANVQQDVQEFCLLFLDALEKKMKDVKEIDGEINRLVEGKTLNYVKCLHVDYQSRRIERFVELQLMVKGLGSIYESLDHYITEELLEGDNRYDSGEYGKQEAKKGIKLHSLPPVLMVQLKRFEYDYLKEAMVKITDYCEFYDEINLDKYVSEEYKGETNYKLFSVLVHSGGGASSGHYYSFIRPDASNIIHYVDLNLKGGQWYKFNDDVVDLAEPDEVFEANFGGVHTEARLNKNKDIEEWDTSNLSTAYMLVYLRVDKIDDLLIPVSNKDVPEKLIEEIETNKKIEDERRRRNEEYIKIYITSYDLLKAIQEPGLSFYKMGNRDEDYVNRFLKDKQKRFKVYLKKSFKVQDLMQFISDNTRIPIEEIMIWKISTNKEQISPVTKRSYFSSGGTNLQLLANGVNSNTTKAVFFVHTLTRGNYPNIFKLCEPYHVEHYGIKCKNTVEFVEYDPDLEIMPPISDSEAMEPLETRILRRASPMLTDLMDEKYIFIFLKAYAYTQNKPILRMLDYFLMRKNAFVRDLVEEVQLKYHSRDFNNATFYREDKKRYTLEELKLEQPIDDESAEYGFVYVFEFKSPKPDYFTAEQYYEALASKVWVTFTSLDKKDAKESIRQYLDGGMRYDELVTLVSDLMYGGTVPPSKIILKSKWKNAMFYNPVPYAESQSLTLADIVKFNEQIQCEVSKIDVDLLDKKVKTMIAFYSTVTNVLTHEEEIFMDKEATVAELVEEIEKKNIFLNERLAEIEAIDRDMTLKAVVLDKKKNVLIGRAVPETDIGLYMSKYRLRIEYIQKMYEEKNLNPEEKYYPLYGVQETKDGELFSQPFLFFAKKNYTGEEFRTRLFNLMKTWQIECGGKEIKITQESFSKLRLFIKTDLGDSKYSKVENDDTYPLMEMEDSAKKFTLEVIHPFNLPREQAQMKIKV